MTAANHRTPIVYLVRHCHATGQGQDPGASLSEVGFQQAEHLAAWFISHPVERVVSSPYTRAIQTIKPLAKQRGLVIETDDRFRERALCSGPLWDWRDRVAASYADLDLCLPGGESCRTAMARGILLPFPGSFQHLNHIRVTIFDGYLQRRFLATPMRVDVGSPI
jgi:2,3-bisphosphoglycerate-dependent phosphoglycerate mutase